MAFVSIIIFSNGGSALNTRKIYVKTVITKKVFYQNIM